MRRLGATLRFACGCSLRLEAVPGEFEERIKRDGYEGREFRKPPRFARRRRGSSFFRKGARRFGRLSTGRGAFARLERNRSERDKIRRSGGASSAATSRAILRNPPNLRSSSR